MKSAACAGVRVMPADATITTDASKATMGFARVIAYSFRTGWRLPDSFYGPRPPKRSYATGTVCLSLWKTNCNEYGLGCDRRAN